MSRRPRILVSLFCVTLTAAGCRKGGDEHGEHAGEHAEKKPTQSEHADEEAVVKLTPAAVERSGIRVDEAKTREHIDAIRLPAEVRLDPDRTAHITPLVSSQVAEVKAKLGDKVDKGQPLVVLRSVELGEARADVASARAGVEVAQDAFERQKQLLDSGVGAQRAYKEAEGEVKKAKARLTSASARSRVYGGGKGGGANTVVVSPLVGTVIERHAAPGEIASPGESLFVIADVRRVWVVGRAYEKDIAEVQVGASATTYLEAYPNRSWNGVVEYVSPVMDEKTRTAEVRVELENAESLLKAGLFGSLAVARLTDGGAAALALPESAVQSVRGRDVVFVPGKEPGEYRAVPVTPGARAAGWVAILGGVTAGQKVVVDGAFTLKSTLLAGEIGEGHAH